MLLPRSSAGKEQECERGGKKEGDIVFMIAYEQRDDGGEGPAHKFGIVR